MKKGKKQHAAVVPFDGACLKLRRVKGKWQCAPTPPRRFTKFPRFTQKKRS